MLLAILSGVRGQVIHALSLDSMFKEDLLVTFRIDKPMKTSKPGKHIKPLVFKAYPHDADLCVLSCLNEYIVRTEPIRKKGCDQLLITHGKPNGPAARSTVTRWMTEVMTAAGINMAIFSSHSVRTAAVSAVSTRLPLSTILKSGGWTSATTFSKYYNKPVVKQCELQDAILQQQQQ